VWELAAREPGGSASLSDEAASCKPLGTSLPGRGGAADDVDGVASEQAVTAGDPLLVSQSRHDLVPVGYVAQHCRTDPAASWAGEQSRIRAGRGIQPFRHHRAYLFDDRNLACALCGSP
jgi:hypothetical protein